MCLVMCSYNSNTKMPNLNFLHSFLFLVIVCWKKNTNVQLWDLTDRNSKTMLQLFTLVMVHVLSRGSDSVRHTWSESFSQAERSSRIDQRRFEEARELQLCSRQSLPHNKLLPFLPIIVHKSFGCKWHIWESVVLGERWQSPMPCRCSEPQTHRHSSHVIIKFLLLFPSAPSRRLPAALWPLGRKKERKRPPRACAAADSLTNMDLHTPASAARYNCLNESHYIRIMESNQLVWVHLDEK